MKASMKDWPTWIVTFHLPGDETIKQEVPARNRKEAKEIACLPDNSGVPPRTKSITAAKK